MKRKDTMTREKPAYNIFFPPSQTRNAMRLQPGIEPGGVGAFDLKDVWHPAFLNFKFLPG